MCWRLSSTATFSFTNVSDVQRQLTIEGFINVDDCRAKKKDLVMQGLKCRNHVEKTEEGETDVVFLMR